MSRRSGPTRPFLKWAGGKGTLLEAILEHVPQRIRTYVEPFVGGGALFFALAQEEDRRYERAVLCDCNEDLVATYRAVRDSVDELIEALRDFRYDEKLYYEVRDRDVRSSKDVERAARLIFLNRTCYNGLYRVNSKGKFNVPFGRYTKPRILDEEGLRGASRALRGVEILRGDFTEVTRSLGRGDFVYFDPPYVPLSKTASFAAYAAGGFSSADQKRLAAELGRLRIAGASALLSNADTPSTRALYEDFDIDRVEAPRSIDSKTEKRGNTYELLVVAEPALEKKRRVAHG